MPDQKYDIPKSVVQSGYFLKNGVNVNPTWEQAKFKCYEQGARLATVKSQVQNDWIYNNNGGNTYLWVGIL